jgi:seryl-tRNA synthetase
MQNMLDINVFREAPELVKRSIKKRRMDGVLPLVDEVVRLDREWREHKKQADEQKAARNSISREIALAKKAGKDAKPLLKRAALIPKRIAELDAVQKGLEAEIRERLLRIPNLTHESVPEGATEECNKVERIIGSPIKHRFEPMHHGELAERLNMGDFKASAKVAGAGFYYLRGDLALLNQALIRFAVDTLVAKGYTYTEPPLMMRKEPYEGVVDLKDFRDVMYKLEGEDAYLIATSEHPLVAQFMGDVIDEKALPIKLVGYSMCFRKEIGSHGVDTRGLFRTHQFNKVEQIVVCRPEDSWKLFEEIQANSEFIFKALGIPIRVVNIASGELSIVASKRYDIEAWMAKQQCYKEVTSCSNCLDYQARRLGIRFFESNGNRVFAHTLNNTGIATSRALVAILENFQTEDGGVKIPKVLQKYMGGKQIIK